MNPAYGRRSAPAPTMTIGEVLALLHADFPDVKMSKIRYLEEEGLVEPDRTPAGYRKYTHADLERLRYVLTVQRDHYLPLRVIKEHLDALDRGLEPPALPGGGPRAPRLVGGPPAGPEGQGADQRLTRQQLIAAAGVDAALVEALESFGIVAPLPGSDQYDTDAVTVTRVAGELAAFGIEPRHLRQFRTAAEREAGLVEQVVAPQRRQRGPEAAGRADEATREVAALCLRLHGALLRAALERSGH